MVILAQRTEKVKQGEDCFKEIRQKEEADLIKWTFPIAWQNVNLLCRFEFYKHQSVINIDEMISLLEQKIVWLQQKVNRRSAGLKNPTLPFRGVEQE